jgi:hypothetical protein
MSKLIIKTLKFLNKSIHSLSLFHILHIIIDTILYSQWECLALNGIAKS